MLKNSLKYQTVQKIVLFVLLILFLVGNTTVLFQYRYPVLGPKNAWMVYALVLLLPVIVFAPVILAKRKRWKILLSVAYIILLLTLTVVLSALRLMTPVAYSYTDDPKHLGEYDEFVVQTLDYAEGSGFPRSIPENAENVRFSYWYMNLTSNHGYLSFACNYSSEKAFRAAIDHLVECGYIIKEGDSLYKKNWNQCVWEEMVLVDWDLHSTTYFMVSQIDTELLPHSLEEVQGMDISQIIRTYAGKKSSETAIGIDEEP